MDRRIFGLENEYGVTCTFRGQRRLSPDEVARFLFRRVVSWGRSSNVFLRNGARLYLDVGSHPEYATPECDSVPDVVVHDRAGERILEGLLVDAEKRLHDEGIAGEIYLFKNNTDSAGNSYGCHENYLVSRHGEFGRLADILIPFLVTRQLICGAGKVLQTPRGAVYCLSQRAEHIWEGVSSATTRSRPIINTRDEPHADAERYRRLHVIVGDSNMSEWSAFLKVGATDIVDRRDDPVAKKVVSMWGHVLDALESQELDRLGRQVDWVTKYLLIERARARHNLPLSHPKIALMDLTYHDVNRKRGLYYLLERREAVERICDDRAIDRATQEPPQTTGARLRGEFIRQAKERRRDYTVDWVHLKLNDQAQRTVLCKDPFRAHDDRVDKLIASM